MGPLLFSRSILLRLLTAIYFYGRSRRSSSRPGGAVNSSPNPAVEQIGGKVRGGVQAKRMRLFNQDAFL
jgi:hypothetical protein